MALLEIDDLKLEFERDGRRLRAVDGVSLRVDAGETVGLVGESGCGKSITALSIGRLLPTPPAHYVGGSVRLEGNPVLDLGARELRRLRGRGVSYIFQEPGMALNPVLRVGRQIRETLEVNRPERAHDAEVVRLLQQVGIPAPESRVRDYPHQMSGGMQQRVMIAMALAAEPRLLVADEPTTALDVTIQAQILDLLVDLRRSRGMGILLITHNLALLPGLAGRVVVMYAGQVVEEGPTEAVLRQPLHPYTRALLRALPDLGRTSGRLEAIPGSVPPLGHWPTGCRFAPRCPVARPECRTDAPPVLEPEPGRTVRCPFPSQAS